MAGRSISQRGHPIVVHERLPKFAQWELRVYKIGLVLEESNAALRAARVPVNRMEENPV